MILSGCGSKHPMSLIESSEVLLPNPCGRFPWVSTPRPAPERLPNVVIHHRVRPLCDDVSMVVRPATDHGVEQTDQSLLLHRAVLPDYLSNILQERVHVPGRRFNQKLAAVFAYILSEKVEALRDMRDSGLLLRELKTTFGEEGLDARFDFRLQQLFRGAGNNEVE